MKLFFPNLYVNSIKDIDLVAIKKQGINNFIIDIDNTLVATSIKEPDEELIKWFRRVKSYGIKVCLASNNNKVRVDKFNEKIKVLSIHRAVKPMKIGFLRAIKMLDGKREDTAVIGDQIFTDILGGNKLGLYTILVKPISKKESILSKVKRPLEKIVLSRFAKQNNR